MTTSPPANENPSNSRLEELVTRCLERVERNGDPAIGEVCGADPELVTAVARRLDLLRRIGLLEGTEPQVGPSGAPSGSPEQFPEVLGDFRLLRRIGGGGMGVVYLAKQESLHREVALKLVRPEHLYFEGAKNRFRREVEAVARLNHPGIVPVFTFGEEKGIPYFAMEHVEGSSLAEVLESLRGRSPSELTGADLAGAIAGVGADEARAIGARLGRNWIQACLRVGHQVASALAHAHERGVLHRDVKPSNVLLTRAGRAVLLDFGLATLRGASKLTQTGSAMGSPHYMPPEMWSGGGTDVDHRADVYQLGVTLYEMLALTKPFRGTAEELIVKVLAGEHDGLRHLNPDVPWDVETVCLKAMDVDRERRYATAAELAQDLENLLELRPIHAARPSTWMRVRRFAQRRPGSTMAVVLAFFLSVIFPLGYAGVLRVKNREVENAREIADQERAIAESHRNATLKAIDAILIGLADPALVDVPGITLVRKRIFEETEAVVAELAASERTHVGVQARVLRLQGNLANMLAILGDHESAAARIGQVIADTERAYGRQPSNPELRIDLDGQRRRAAEFFQSLGRTDDARRVGEHAVDDLREFLAAYPDHFPATREFLAALSTGVANALDRGDLATRERLETERQGAVDAALSRWPEDESLNLLQLRILSSAAVYEAHHGSAEKLRSCIARGEAALERVRKRGASGSMDAQAIASACANLAECHSVLDQYRESLRLLETGTEIIRGLIARYPERPAYRHMLGRLLGQIGEVRNLVGYEDPDAKETARRRSLEEFAEAASLMRTLDQEGFSDTDLRSDLCAVLGSYGDWLANGGDLELAVEAHREAVARLDAEMAVNPDNPTNLDNLVVTLLEQARTEGKLGALDSALSLLARCVSVLEQERTRELLRPDWFPDRVASVRILRAELLESLGRHSAAHADLREVIALEQPARVLAAVARRCDRCIALARDDSMLDDAARATAVSAIAATAVEAVKDLERAELEAIDSDPDLVALRETREWKDFAAVMGLD